MKRFFLAAIALLMVGGAACKTVDAREVCIKTKFGKVKGEVTGVDGNPLGLNDYHCYPTTSRVYEVSSEPDKSKADYRDIPVDARTKDGQRIDAVTYTIRFSLPRGQIQEVFQSIPGGMDCVLEQVVKFHSRATVRQLLVNYDAETLNSPDLARVNEAITSRLREEFSAKHVSLESFELKKLDFNDEYEAALNKRQIAEQDRERAAIEAETTRRQAEAAASAAREQAKGEADSIALRGEAIRRNPEVVQLEAIAAIKSANVIYLPSTGVQALLPTPAVRP